MIHDNKIIPNRWNRRRVTVLVMVICLLFVCGSGMLVARQQMMRPIYPNAIPYGEAELECSAIGHCYSLARFYTHDTPETVDKYFNTAGLQLVSYGSAGGRSTFQYIVFESGFINVGPFVFSARSQLFINYEDIGEGKTTILQDSSTYLFFQR